MSLIGIVYDVLMSYTYYTSIFKHCLHLFHIFIRRVFVKSFLFGLVDFYQFIGDFIYKRGRGAVFCILLRAAFLTACYVQFFARPCYRNIKKRRSSSTLPASFSAPLSSFSVFSMLFSWGISPSSAPAIKTTGNSSPFAA